MYEDNVPSHAKNLVELKETLIMMSSFLLDIPEMRSILGKIYIGVTWR